jgi:hypothetical protein
MNEVSTRPGATALSTDLLSKLKTGIAESRASTVIAGGKPLLRMLRDSQWVYGQRDDAVQENSSWAINPLSIAHGWCAWTNHEGGTKNTLVGEVMSPVHEPKPPRPAPVDNWPFTEQRMFELRCMDGDDQGTEVVYKISSVGGMRAVDELLSQLQVQLGENPNYPCPVVQLMTDSYQHTKWGKIYVPIFDIVDWSTMDGRLDSEDNPTATNGAAAAPAPTPAPAPAPTPRPRGRPPAQPAAQAQPAPHPAPAPVTPEPTARRRPIRR